MANLLTSYNETNQNNFTQLGSGSYTGFGQSFTGNAEKLYSAKFYLRKTGSPTGNVVAKLYAHSGTFGTSSVPTGSALATSATFDISTLTTSFQLIEFLFTGANQYVMTNGIKYFIAVEYTGGGGSDLLEPGYDTSSPTHEGNMARNFGGWISASGADACFYVYTEPNSTDYPIVAAQGSLTLTGQASILTSVRNMVAEVGSFVLTGQNALFSYGKTIIAAVGSFVLTGQDAVITSTRTLVAALGQFTLTGQTASLLKGYLLTAARGLFTLTGQTVALLVNGTAVVWSKLSKSSAPTYTKISKSSTSWDETNKSSDPTWTKQDIS